MWTPNDPENFSQFIPSDMMSFLAWWEEQHANAIALELSGAFVDGVTVPYLEELATDFYGLPEWIKTLLRWRWSAQWAYQLGYPLAQKVQQGLPGLLPIDMPNMPVAYQLSPQDIAEIPPQIRQGFQEGMKFSLGWVKRLSTDARQQMRDLLAINELKNRNPKVVVPILEQVLRRDLVARLTGQHPENISVDQIQEWVENAQFKVLAGIANRAELISQTESMRMTNMGILTSLEGQGEEMCFVMPHRGSCPDCQRLIDGRVFRVEVLKRNLFANFGKKKSQWVASLPQHPRCRHSPMEVPVDFMKAIKIYGKVPDEGILLEWYGLPGKRKAFEELSLPREPWLTTAGVIE